MTIGSTASKLSALAASLAAGTLLLVAATGGGNAAPLPAGAGVTPLEPMVHAAAKRDHRSSAGGTTTSSSQGGVTVGGKDTKAGLPPRCGRGCSVSGSALRDGNIRDHRSPRGSYGSGGR